MMNTDEFKKQLASVTPDVPEHFHNRVEMTLENIVLQEAQIKESTKQAVKTAGRFSGRTLAIALALVLVLAAAAFAASQWNLFGALPHLAGESPVNADSVMQKDLHTETVNNVEISIDEVGYDGRTLLIQRSYRMLDVDRVLGEEDNYEQMLWDRHVGWWIDAIWINGKETMMPNGSESTVAPGEEPVQVTEDIMGNSEFTPLVEGSENTYFVGNGYSYNLGIHIIMNEYKNIFLNILGINHISINLR